jgi:hypothetical protein
VGRVVATRYSEIVTERLYTGKIQLERSLQELILAAETVLDLEAARRKRTIVRCDGGGGRDADVNWLLERDYFLLTKVKNWQRARKLIGCVQTWFADRKDPKRSIGWVQPGHVYARPTRQIAVREPRPKGKLYQYVLVFNLSDEMIFHLNQLPYDPSAPPEQLLSLILHLYDLRSGGIETSNRNSKSGLGLHKRNKRSFTAQEMLVLLAQLAYNVLLWVRQTLADQVPRLIGFGLLRMVRDLLAIPGKIWLDEQGRVITIVLSQHHVLARTFCQAIPPAWLSNDLRLILRKI